jgi:hypothetical protein
VFSAYWRFDDGSHLEFVTRYGAFQYFFVPEITRAQSGIHLTPWNALFYDLGLAAAGDWPAAHYAHLLMVIAAASVTAFTLQCRVAGVVAALTASLVFISGYPTLIVANELMSGHYAYGLLFAGLAAVCFLRYLRVGSRWALWTSAGFYLLGSACKEIFTPLPAILFFLGERALRERVFGIVPFALVSVFYLGWRVAVLGNLSAAYVPVDVAVLERALELGRFVGFLFYSSWPFLPAAVVLGGATIAAVAAVVQRLGVRGALILGASFAVLVLPLWVLTGRGLLEAPSRYLFVPWFMLSLLVGYAVGQIRGGVKLKFVAGGAVIASALGVSLGHQELGQAEDASLLEAIYEGVSQLENDEFILLPSQEDILQVSGLARKFCIAHQRLTGKPCRSDMFIASRTALDRILQLGGKVYAYDPSCRCLNHAPVESLRRRADELDRIRCQGSAPGVASSHPLSVQVWLREGHLHWTLGPYSSGQYQVYMDGLPIPHRVPPEGRSPFAPRAVELQVSYSSLQGWTVLSPELTFDPAQVSGLNWSGTGIHESVCDEPVRYRVMEPEPR